MRQIARDFAIRDYNSKISKAGLNLLRFRKNFSEGNIQFEDLGNLETVVIKP